MRLFLAVFPPDDVQVAASRAADALRASPGGRGVAWVKRENLHWTLRFLGERDEAEASRAAQALRAAAVGHAPFDVALSGAGAFPNARRARVLWLGLAEGDAPLRALAASLERALRELGFAAADKPFAPHLTLGRVRERDADWSAGLAALRVDAPRFRVGEARLVRSTLAPGGSRYETLERVPLGGSGV